MKNQKSLRLAAWSAVSISCLAPIAFAQEGAPAAAPGSEQNDTKESQGEALEEVVVTADRRREALQTVPAAITAISAETLRRDGINSLERVADSTPGLTFAAFAAGQPEIAIRGVGTKEDGPAASDSTVVSIDDIYIASRAAQVTDLFDLERVEVLRGPQGTLYGKNSIGGSINFVTLQPTDETVIRTTLKGGNFGRAEAAGLISGGLTDTLFGKVAVSYKSNDGYLRNALVDSPDYGKRVGETESLSYRTTLRWAPTDTFEAIFSIDGAHDDNGATNREPVGSLGPLHNCGCASDPVAVNNALGGGSSPYTTLASVDGFTKRDIFGASLKLNFDLGFATLSSISGYRKTDYSYLEDSSGLPSSSVFVNLAPGGNGGVLGTLPAATGFTFKVTDAVEQNPKQLTQELRLTSPTDEKFEWLGGLFFSREEDTRTEGFVFPSLGSANGLPSDSLSIQTNKGTAYAGYGQLGYSFTDRFKLTAGARYSSEKKEITSAAQILSGLPLLLRAYPEVGAEESWTNFSWRLVGDFQATPDTLFYASVATGFKSGGLTGVASTAEVATTPFKPEDAVNYEVGEKIELFDHRLRINTAVFYTDYKDLQVTRFFQPVGTTFGQFITENAGQARLKGVELEISARPIRAIEIGGTYAYLDARYTEFTGLASTINPTGNFNGNFLRQAPKNSASAYLAYTFTMNSGGELSARAGWKYQSLSYYDPDNNPITVIPSYQLLDGRIGYSSPDKHWDLSAWIKNANDERYRTHVFSQRDGRVAFALFGEPRTYGLTLTYNH